MRRIYTVDRGCTFCGTCIFECPAQAITLEKNGAVIDPGKCTGCGRCYENCASEAISVYEKEENKKETKGQEK